MTSSQYFSIVIPCALAIFLLILFMFWLSEKSRRHETLSLSSFIDEINLKGGSFSIDLEVEGIVFSLSTKEFIYRKGGDIFLEKFEMISGLDVSIHKIYRGGDSVNLNIIMKDGTKIPVLFYEDTLNFVSFIEYLSLGTGLPLASNSLKEAEKSKCLGYISSKIGDIGPDFK